MNIASSLYNLIGNGYLTTFLISIIPMFELKGGILFARSAEMGFFESYLFAFLGSTVVFFLVFFLLQPILKLLKKVKWFRSFADSIENYFKKKAEQSIKSKKKADNIESNGQIATEMVSEKRQNMIKTLAVFIFVALPLPLTGVWTGTAVAVFLGLKFRYACPAVALGNAVAGLIISVLAELFFDYVDYILYGFLGLVVVCIIIAIVKIILSKPKKKAD